jgi:hypothetical protein
VMSCNASPDMPVAPSARRSRVSMPSAWPIEVEGRATHR